MKKAVIFDMDGVLLDSERLYRMHWLQAAKLYGIEEDHMRRICNRIAGGSSSHTKAVFAEELGADFPYEEMRQRVLDDMDAYILVHGIDVKPGIIELLRFLKEKHVKIGLATSTEETRAVKNLKNAGLLSFFDGLMFGNKIQHSKPAPDIYLEACREVGVKPEEAVGVEDSINGIFACIHAHMTAVMIIDLIEPTPEIRQQADYIFDSAFDLIEHWNEL